MQDQTEPVIPSSSGIAVVLEIAEPVVIGLSVIIAIYVVNRGNSPIDVSSRLNLMEGDVQLLITDPAGNKQKVFGAGGQPDTALRRKTLLPGQEIAAGINLLYTNIGETFKMPGTYVLQAVYFPSPNMETVYSNPVSVTAQMPQTDTERKTASILQSEELKRAIVIPESDNLPNQIAELAANFADTQDGKLASLLLAESRINSDDTTKPSEVFSAAEPVSVALWITALSTPFSNVGDALKSSFTEFLDDPQSVDRSSAENDSSEMTKALKILNEDPF